MPPITGCAYYPEHWPPERWPQDAALMHEAGLSVVRLAEFAWDKMEPQPGIYDFEWLNAAVAILHGAGLNIVLCTPTASPPAWLTHQHPEICRVEVDGVRVSPGARRTACANVPAYQEASQRIVEQIARRFGQHPAVIGWQIDNEFGVGETTRCYCDHCRGVFQNWLREQYGTLDALNAAWGTQFWGMTYRDWNHIPIPGVTNEPQSPSLRLDYRRFASDSWMRFQRKQIAVLHRFSPGRWITHNFMVRHWSLDYWKLAEDLDLVSYDNYPHGLQDPVEVSMNLDLMRSFKRRPFWIMEQQPGRVNWHPYNPPVPHGQVRVWSHQGIAHGAEAIVYFSFRPTRSGQEQYHAGLLQWDGSRAPVFGEVRAVADEFAALPTLTRPAAKVGIVFDYHDLWSIELEPHTRDFSYWNLVYEIYRAYWDADIPIDFLPRGTGAEGYETLIVPAAILIRPGEAEHWRIWVEQGGRLIVTFRAGVREPSNISALTGLPGGGLGDLAGVRIKHFLAVPPSTYTDWPDHRAGTRIRAVGGGDVFAYKIWAETLEPTSAQPLFTYLDGMATGETAVARNAIGAGEVIYLGCWVEDFSVFARALGWITGATTPLQRVLLHGGDGSRWQVTLNHRRQTMDRIEEFGVRYEKVSYQA
jgi:beta-galactosidase